MMDDGRYTSMELPCHQKNEKDQGKCPINNNSSGTGPTITIRHIGSVACLVIVCPVQLLLWDT